MARQRANILAVLIAFLLPTAFATHAQPQPFVGAAAPGEASQASLGPIIYVDASASEPGDGTSWATAFADLQDGLADAESGNEVWVAEGIYYPTTDTDRTISFQLISGVAVYGGFPAGGGTFEDRDPEAHETVLSGDIGDAGTHTDNSMHVVNGSGVDATALLDGFTITGGYADYYQGPDDRGGGLFIVDGSPRVSNCVLVGSRATYGGGGVYSSGGSPVLTDVTLMNNVATYYGGGVYAYQGGLKVYNARFLNNYGGYSGGGITMSQTGTGVVIANAIFLGNTVTYDGGGIYVWGDSPALRNLTIYGNLAAGTSGRGGGIYNFYGSPTIVNTILWANTAGSQYPQLGGAPGLPAIANCVVEGGYSNGTGIISDDPLLVDADGADDVLGTLDDDLRLSPGSPAIDAGHNDWVPADAGDLDADANTTEPLPLDLDRQPRFVDLPDAPDTGVGTPPLVDIGAYERPRTCWARLNDSPTDYGTVQDAVDAGTSSDDLVKVAGTCGGVTARGGITQTLYLSTTLTVQGGYTETFAGPPDPVAYPTVLDAGGAGRVVSIVGDVSPTLAGLRLTGGDATELGGMGEEWDRSAGGGVYVMTATATISNCWIYGNTADAGAGVAMASSAGELRNSEIYSNTGTGLAGGGVAIALGTPTVSGNHVFGNESYDGRGGGMDCTFSTATIIGNTFENNYTNEYGGGLVAENCQGSTISDNTAAGNRADWGAGGMGLYEMDGATVSGNVITENSGEFAGGLDIVPHGAITLTGNLISGNAAVEVAGAYFGEGAVWSSADRIEGNTAEYNVGGALFEFILLHGENLVVADNEALGGDVGGIYLLGTEADMLHSTVARNSGTGIGIITDPGVVSTVTLTNTIVASHDVGVSVDGGNLLTMDGVLWDPGTPVTVSASITATVDVQHQLVGHPAFDADGYHLTAESDAIDQGVDSGLVVDIDGDPRPYGLGYDLGADEIMIDLPIEGLNATSDSPTTLGQTTTLTATITAGSPVTFTWDFGDGEGGEGAVVTHTYSDVGVYTATVTAWNSVSAPTATTQVVIQDVPITDLLAVNDSPTELGGTTHLTATIAAGTNVSYEWDLGDGTQTSGANVSHIYPAVGLYTAVVTATNGVGSVSTSTAVTVTDVPITGLVANNDSPTELGGPTTLYASVATGSGTISFYWNLGDGQGAWGQTVIHTYGAAGTYTAIVTATNSAGEVSASTTVTIADVTIAGLVAINDSPTELGGETHLTATVTAGTNVVYQWDLGDGTPSSGATVSHVYPAVGPYTAVVTASNGTGEMVAETAVTITDIPISGLVAVNDSPTELDDPTTLSASVAAGSNVEYTWDLGDGQDATGAEVIHSYAAVGTYMAVVTATNSISELSASTLVTVTIPPCQARIDGDTELYKTVQEAIDAADVGDLIRIAGYCEGLNEYGYPYEQVRLNKSVTLRGGFSPDFGTWDPALYPTVLDAQGLGRVVYVTGGTPTVPITPALESLHLTGGASDYRGGGLYSLSYSDVTVSDCLIYGNSAQSGGGLYLSDDATVLNSEIYQNTIDGNDDGAGLALSWSDGTLIQANQIYSNTSTAADGYFYQGAVYLEHNTGAILRENLIHGNGGTYRGGGIALFENTDTTLEANQIYGHTSTEGAGIYLNSEVGLTLTGNELYDNHGNEGGAVGMEYGSGLTLVDNLIHHNTASSGGGVNIFQGPGATMSGNEIRDNTASFGGGINIYQSDGITVTGNAFLDNVVDWYSGGIRVVDALTVTISGNVVLGNTADQGAAGLTLVDVPNATLINNIIADNRHTQGYSEGGIQISHSHVDMIHNTLARNDAWGLYAQSDATVAMTDTIVAGHAVGVYVGSTSTVTLEATLWGSGDWANSTDWMVSAGTLSTVTLELWGDPAFVDPDWGNYHVLSASDAVDEGIDAGVYMDIDGDSRPTGTGFDIGADEVAPDDPVAGLSAGNDSPMELRDVTTLTATVTAGDNVVFDWDLGDGSMAHGPIVEHVYPAVGTYTAVVTASNSTNSATDTTVVTITDNEPIISLWATNDGPTSLGKGTNLLATTVGGTNIVYDWDFGDESPPALDAGAEVVHTYPAEGSYTAVVTASNSTSLLTDRTTVQVERTCWARVNDDATDYGTVQAAVNAAISGDLIKVSGTCLDQVAYYGSSTVLSVNKTLTVTGGYSNDFAIQDPDLYPTVLDGEGNDYVVVVWREEFTPTVTLEDLRVTNGVRTGIYVSYGIPLIRNCEIDHNGNSVTGEGGAHLIGAVDGEVSGSRIHHNESWADGGGLTIYNSSGFSLAGNAIYANQSGKHGRGGGVYILDSPDATVSNNQIYANLTAGNAWGGGICVYTSDNVTLQGNRIYDHDAYVGGGIYFFSPGGRLADNWVYWNTADSSGGIRIGSQDVTLENNVVADNSTGIEVNGGSAHMIHNTVVRNRTWIDLGFWTGAGIVVPSGSVWMTDTLIAAQPVGVDVSSSGVVTMEATFLGDGAWANTDDWANWGGSLITGTINIYGDPAFVNPANANYHLLAASEARDVGIDAGTEADIDGDARPHGPGFDIGADEYVDDAPIAGLTAVNDSPTELGDVTHLSATVSTGSNVSYEWDLGDGSTGQGSLVEHAYAQPGLYTAVVTATNNAGVATADTVVTVYEEIAALPGGGEYLTSDGALGFEWPPETAGAMNIVYTPQLVPTNDPGDFELAGMVFHLDVTDEFGDPITSFSPPMTVTVYYDEAALPPEIAEADLELRRYDVDLEEWVRPVQTLNVDVNTIVVTLDHFSEFAVMVPTTVPPIAGLEAVNDSPTELGGLTTFTATVTSGTDILYQWNFGDGTGASGNPVTHTYEEVGIYTATVTATNGAGEVSATTVVTIADVPITGLVAVNDSPTELGGLTTFTATVTAGTDISYQWDFGDGTGASGNPVSHTYEEVGIYTATVTVTNSAGEVSATTMVTIADVPITGLAAVNDSPTELGGLTTFTATVTAGTNISYQWDFGDGTGVSGNPVSHTYDEAGIYTATVTATNSAGEVSATTAVTVTEVTEFEYIYLPLVLSR